MQELAPLTIWTVAILVEAFALLCLVVLMNVSLLLQFVRAVREGARVFELTLSCLSPVLANLSLVFDFEAFYVLANLLFGAKLLLAGEVSSDLARSCCQK